jgi:uncharacterized protein
MPTLIEGPEARRVTFLSDGLRLEGDLYVPAGTNAPRPGLVFSGPLTAVKEQVVGIYARKLAARGYVTLAFDHRNWGGSEGTPPQHEDSGGKLKDLRDAVSYLRGLPEVDPERIGAVGVCLGAGYVLRFAAFDPRVKAVALVAGWYNDPRFLRQILGEQFHRQQLSGFAAAAEAQYRSGEVAYLPAVSATGPSLIPGPEPFEYYGTPRSASPGWVNQATVLTLRELFSLNNAFAAEVISPTPVLMVHGEQDAIYPPQAATALFATIGEPKQMVWLPTKWHIDLYDQEQYVAPAVAAADEWFARHLTSVGASER